MVKLPIDSESAHLGVDPSGELKLFDGQHPQYRQYWAGTLDHPHPDIPKEKLNELRKIYNSYWSSSK